jgi:hypothetical protein
MKTIPSHVIDEVWERVNDTPEDEVKELVDRFGREQPALLAYLMASDEDTLEQDERGNLMYLGLIIWLVLSESQPNLPQVSIEALEAAEDANITYLSKLEAGSEMGIVDAVQEMISTYNQMPLLGAMVEALMEGNEEEPEMAGENVGMSLLHLKTVIDCLDK